MTDESRQSEPAANTASPGLEISVRERGATTIASISGFATAEFAGQLSRTLQELAIQKPGMLAIDLSGLAFVSSTGLGSMVAAHVTCMKHGVKLFLINPKPAIFEILQITKLTKLFSICETVQEAEQLASAS